MKRTQFTIQTSTGPKEVSGLVDTIFGLHKNEHGTYSVTHLPTGYAAVHGFTHMRQARAFITQAEQVHAIDVLDLDNARSYAEELVAIKNACYKL